MTTPEITRIRAAIVPALVRYGDTEDFDEETFEFLRSVNPKAMAAVLAHIDQQQAEIERLRVDAARYQWLKKHPQWLGWEHDFRPDEVEREVDAAMKESL